MSNICARFVQDCTYSPMCNIWTRFAQDCTSFSNALYMQYMCKRGKNMCARFARDGTYFLNEQYMRKICARLYLFSQCATYAQDLRKICARLYLFLQCTIYAQDLRKIVLISSMRKIVLISSMRNISRRFAQDCTNFPNAQYIRKIGTRLYLFLQCAI